MYLAGRTGPDGMIVRQGAVRQSIRYALGPVSHPLPELLDAIHNELRYILFGVVRPAFFKFFFIDFT